MHSQWNELDGTLRGSSAHSNHPNDDSTACFLLLLQCVVNYVMHDCTVVIDITLVIVCYVNLHLRQ
jgi:hypothetical protein